MSRSRATAAVSVAVQAGSRSREYRAVGTASDNPARAARCRCMREELADFLSGVLTDAR